MADVLVADEEAATRTLISEVLSDYGDQVRSVRSGPECARLTQAHHFDAAILDAATCGSALIGSIVQLLRSRNPQVRIVDVRDRTDPLPADSRTGGGDHPILTKPVAISELIRAVHGPTSSETQCAGAGSSAMLPTINMAELCRLPIREARARFERVYLEHHLGVVDRRIGKLAIRLGIERTYLYRKLHTLGLLTATRSVEGASSSLRLGGARSWRPNLQDVCGGVSLPHTSSALFEGQS